MKIFEPFSFGEIQLKNKIVMAPMTRSRAIDNIPNDLMVKYYSQRAGAGLIITEGTSPSANGLGYARIPGAFSEPQIQGWKKIADAVHQKNSKIFVQLMHCGRASSSYNLPTSEITIAPSAVQLSGEIYTDMKGMQEYDIPKEMTQEDIINTQNAYVDSAVKLIEKAEIDGIELHAANGYLLNQFLNPNSNIRTDEYGGDYKNRARFVIETVQKTVNAIGNNRVGVRFSPYGVFNDMLGEHDDVIAMFSYLAQELAKMDIAYIHLVDQRVAMGAPEFASDINKTIKENFKGTVIVGGDVNTAQKGEALLNQGYDLVYIGRPFIANPTLVEKLKNNSDLVQPDFDKFYSATAEGYTDYA